MDDEVDVEAYETAREHLKTAINDFYEAVEPGVYVSDWVLVTHRQSIELEQDGGSMVGILTGTAQSFPMTRGMLEVALDAERFS